MSLPPFELVVVDHGPMVLRICRAVLGSSEADDAWSDTFLAALRAYPDLDDGANVAAWLATIAHRKAIDRTRRRARQPVAVGAAEEVADSDKRRRRSTATSAPPPGADEPVDHDLAAALAQLTDRQQTAVLFHHVAGLPHAEVATLLGSSPAAARRSAADGIAKLRALLSHRP